MGDVIKFKPKSNSDLRTENPHRFASIEYMYAPEIDPTHPYAFRINALNPESGVWLDREEYISLVCELVEQLSEETVV